MADERNPKDPVPESWDGAFQAAFARPAPIRPSEPDDPRYELGDEIGRGGVGLVYRSHDRELDRDVAVKVLRPEHTTNEGLVHRFVEEAKVAGRLEHPGIVPVYSAALPDRGRARIAMKLVEGTTFSDRLRKGAGVHRSLTILEQVALTIAYAHSRRVVHRDLKPGNVMVGEFGEVLVVDWGFAKVLGETVEATGDVVGTPGYMSPEQARGEVDALTDRTDVFALGAMLCLILTGQPAATGRPREALDATREGRIGETLVGCDGPGPLVNLARRCIAVVPDERPAAEEFAATIGEHLAAVEESARRAEIDAVAADADAARERRVRRLFATLAVVVIVGLGLAAAVTRHLGLKRLARESETASLVAAALREAAQHESGGRFEAALAAVDSALALVTARDADEETIARVEERREKVVVKAEAARNAADRDRRLRTILAEIDEIRVEMFDSDAADLSVMDARLRALFKRHGFDLDESPPEEIGGRLRESPLAAEIAGALAEWPAKGGQILEILAAVDPDDRWTRLLAAYETGDPGAILHVAAALTEERAPARFLVAASRLISGRRRRAAALILLHTAHALRPDDLYITRALAYEPSRPESRWIGPIRFGTALLALRPESSRALVDLAWSLARAWDHEEVIALSREALRRDPGLPLAHALLGISLVRTGKVAEGLAACAEGVRLGPGNVRVVATQGVALLTTGDPEGAVEAFLTTTELRPDFMETRVWLARAQLAAGRPDEARRSAETALAGRLSNASRNEMRKLIADLEGK